MAPRPPPRFAGRRRDGVLPPRWRGDRRGARRAGGRRSPAGRRRDGVLPPRRRGDRREARRAGGRRSTAGRRRDGVLPPRWRGDRRLARHAGGRRSVGWRRRAVRGRVRRAAARSRRGFSAAAALRPLHCCYDCPDLQESKGRPARHAPLAARLRTRITKSKKEQAPIQGLGAAWRRGRRAARRGRRQAPGNAALLLRLSRPSGE